jgi:hypothetical protein
MVNVRSLVLSVSIAVASVPLLHTQDLSAYRAFRFGMSITAVAKLARVSPSEAQVLYQRPAVIQELQWRPARASASSAADPVGEVLFGFYNGELYRIVVTYDEDRTEGLTNADMIEAISAKYGAPSTPTATIVSSSPSQVYSDSQQVIARWEEGEHSFSLFRFAYQPAFGMLALSTRLDALAQVSIVEAKRLQDQEAPQREIERQKKQDEEKRVAGEKVRPVNKANFRP